LEALLVLWWVEKWEVVMGVVMVPWWVEKLEVVMAVVLVPL
jgi:hypothetical protein